MRLSEWMMRLTKPKTLKWTVDGMMPPASQIETGEYYGRTLENILNDTHEVIDAFCTAHGSHATRRLLERVHNTVCNAYRDGRNKMRRTYTLEVKIDFDDESRHDQMRKVLREAGRSAYALAMLLADNRQPQIALRSEDFFEGTQEILIKDDDDEETTDA